MHRKITEGCIDIGIPPFQEVVDKDVAFFRSTPFAEQYGTFQNVLAKSGTAWIDAHQCDKRSDDPAVIARGDVSEWHNKHVGDNPKVKIKPGEEWLESISTGEMTLNEPEQAKDKAINIRRKKK